MNKAQHKVAASVTVYRVGDMKTRGRKAVCGWLRKLADDLQNEPEAYAKTFRARYLYPANRKDQGYMNPAENIPSQPKAPERGSCSPESAGSTSGFWRSARGENHGLNSQPGDVWVEREPVDVVKHLCGHLRGVLDMLGTCDNFDHHGYCQSHFVESPCRVAKAREFLESLSNAAGQGAAKPYPAPACSQTGGEP